MNNNAIPKHYREFWPGCPIRVRPNAPTDCYRGILGEIVAYSPHQNGCHAAVTARHFIDDAPCLTWSPDDVEPLGCVSILGVGDYWAVRAGPTVYPTKVIGVHNENPKQPLFIVALLGSKDADVLIFDEHGEQRRIERDNSPIVGASCVLRFNCQHDAEVYAKAANGKESSSETAKDESPVGPVSFQPDRDVMAQVEKVTAPISDAIARHSAKCADERRKQIERMIELGLKLTETNETTSTGFMTTWVMSMVETPQAEAGTDPAGPEPAKVEGKTQYEDTWKGVMRFLMDHMGYQYEHQDYMTRGEVCGRILPEAGYTVWLDSSNGWCWRGGGEHWKHQSSHPAAVLVALKHMHAAKGDDA